MKQLRKAIYIIAIILTVFLALTAFLGGIGLLTGLTPLPIEDLEGSIFNDYTIPAISLFVIIGGSALLAAIMLIRKSKFALLCSTTAGTIIMFFEFVEVMVIGAPPGIARTLQLFYFGLGVVIIVVSMGIWFLDLRSEAKG